MIITSVSQNIVKSVEISPRKHRHLIHTRVLDSPCTKAVQLTAYVSLKIVIVCVWGSNYVRGNSLPRDRWLFIIMINCFYFCVRRDPHVRVCERHCSQTIRRTCARRHCISCPFEKKSPRYTFRFMSRSLFPRWPHQRSDSLEISRRFGRKLAQTTLRARIRIHVRDAN